MNTPAPPDYEKHTTTTDALDTLGSIIGPDEKRDAIHLAVEPARAGDLLRAGEYVTIDPATNIAVVCDEEDAVGIVDPFLLEAVAVNEWFWLVVKPRQISSLRHVWEHPSFAPSQDLAGDTKRSSLSQQDARDWIMNYLTGQSVNTDNFDYIIDQVVAGRDIIVDRDGSSYGTASNEFYDMVEVYVGKPVPHINAHFSCSC